MSENKPNIPSPPPPRLINEDSRDKKPPKSKDER